MKNKNSGKIIKLTAAQAVETLDYTQGDLSTLQAGVAGMISIMPYKAGVYANELSRRKIVVVVNDEALMDDLAYNYGASTLYYVSEMGPIAGDVLFVGDDGENLTSLSNEQYEYVQALIPTLIKLGLKIEVALGLKLGQER